VCGFTPVQRGVLIGVPIAVIGFGAWGAGWIADRFGSARVRWWSALAYAAAIGMLPLAAVTGFQVALLASVLLGLAGAALLPTSLNLAMATGRGSVGMGLHRTAGDLGYLFGILAAAGSLALLKSWVDPTSAYPAVITTFAGFHACTTGAILFLTSR
jgi:MFS family permease